MEKVLVDEVASAPAGADVAALPERVQAALGELAGAAKEGLLALSVGVGLGVRDESSPTTVGGGAGSTAIGQTPTRKLRTTRAISTSTTRPASTAPTRTPRERRCGAGGGPGGGAVGSAVVSADHRLPSQ